MIAQTPNIINKRILQIAVPSIISNITVPLLGLIDVTIVGHLGAAAYIGAIAVGGMLFNIIYWIFGFLRMGTSGMTSQAYGKHDLDEVARLFITVCRSRIAYRHYLSDIAISHPEAGIHFYTNYRGSRAIGYTLFPDLYMGSSCYARTLWIRRLVHRYAEFTFPDVHRHHTKYC